MVRILFQFRFEGTNIFCSGLCFISQQRSFYWISAGRMKFQWYIQKPEAVNISLHKDSLLKSSEYDISTQKSNPQD